MRRSFWLAVAGGVSLALGANAQPPAPTVPTVPATPAQPAPMVPASPMGQPALTPAPWANKFFLADIATNRDQASPQVITHNFGEVPHGTLCAQKFTITNIYDVPMQITDVRKSCTCLDYVPLNKALQPNETAEFTVTMNAGKFVGFNAQTFYITFGPKYVSTAVVRVQATSRTEVSVSPGAVTFGTVPGGTKATQSVSVKYSGRGRDWKLTDVSGVQGPYEVKVNEVNRGGPLRGGVEYQVDFTMKGTTTPLTIADQVTIKTTDPTYPTVQIAVTGAIAAPIELAPNTVRFDGVAVGTPATQRVLVRAAKAFKVTGFEGAGDGITVELPSAGGALQVQIVTVKFDPKQVGSVTRSIRIKTDLDGGIVTLPVEAEAVAK